MLLLTMAYRQLTLEDVIRAKAITNISYYQEQEVNIKKNIHACMGYIIDSPFFFEVVQVWPLLL